MSPQVSVVMVCRDGLPYLLEALGSVLAQTFTDWELVFWDNGSKDDSREAAARLSPDVRVLGSPDPIPLAEARNRLTAAARGEYVAFLDADDLWYPEKLERQLEAMTAHGSTWSYTDCRIVSARGEPLGRFARRVPQRSGHVTRALLRENFIPLSTVVIDRAALIEAGGFDVTFGVANDYDLWLRLSTRTAVLGCPRVASAYRVHGSNLTGRYGVTYRENRLIYRRWAIAEEQPAPVRAAAREAQALLSLRWGLREIVEGRNLRRGFRRLRVGVRRARRLRTIIHFAVRAVASSRVRLKMAGERNRAQRSS
ncbi:MAG: glycosyltransferase family 2 protein [Longimicrobiales bacterium]